MMNKIATQPNNPLPESSVQIERRIASNRRRNDDRRSQDERRFDSRTEPVQLRKAIKIWFRSLTHSRLGVDRRKRRDRRHNQGDRREQQRLGVTLTREELADLLS